MKDKENINLDLSFVTLLYILIILSFIYFNSQYDKYVLISEINDSKELIVEQSNENNRLYNIINYLNIELTTKKEELQEYEDLKQLKDDVREFWNR